jgi:hypothetical protein
MAATTLESKNLTAPPSGPHAEPKDTKTTTTQRLASFTPWQNRWKIHPNLLDSTKSPQQPNTSISRPMSRQNQCSCQMNTIDQSLFFDN